MEQIECHADWGIRPATLRLLRGFAATLLSMLSMPNMQRLSLDESLFEVKFLMIENMQNCFADPLMSLPAKNGSLAECAKLTQGGRKDG